MFPEAANQIVYGIVVFIAAFSSILFYIYLGLYLKVVKEKRDLILFKSGSCINCNKEFLKDKTGFEFTVLDADFLVVACKVVEENETLKKKIAYYESLIQDKPAVTGTNWKSLATPDVCFDANGKPHLKLKNNWVSPN